MKNISVIKKKPNNRARNKIVKIPVNASTTFRHNIDSEKNTAVSLLKFFGTWQGDDIQELLKEVKNTRSIIEF